MENSLLEFDEYSIFRINLNPSIGYDRSVVYGNGYDDVELDVNAFDAISVINFIWVNHYLAEEPDIKYTGEVLRQEANVFFWNGGGERDKEDPDEEDGFDDEKTSAGGDFTLYLTPNDLTVVLSGHTVAMVETCGRAEAGYDGTDDTEDVLVYVRINALSSEEYDAIRNALH